MPSLTVLLCKHWFLFGILGSILLAEIFPSLGALGGPLKPEWTVKYIAVGIIFYSSGLSLSSTDIIAATGRIKVHLFVQIFTFIIIPVFILFLNTVLTFTFSMNEWILKGLAVVSCMPPPVSSAVILTRAVGGDEAVAIFNSVFGSFLGLVISPITILFILGTTSTVSLFSTIITLGETVLLPLILGQLTRQTGIIILIKKSFPVTYNFNFSAVGQFTLLFIIYTTFCDVFQTHDMPMHTFDVLITVALVLLVQIAVLFVSFETANYMKYKYAFSPGEIIAITFCSTHKSLTLGIPILRILFSGYAHFSQITLPLLMYHPTQIILGGLLVPYLKKWMITRKNEYPLLP